MRTGESVEADSRTTSDYAPIGDYALIGDCHTAALVARAGSIDWCCLPRFDSDSSFGRLLDARHGGHFSISPVEPFATHREYLGDSLVLATTFECARGAVRLIDFFSMREGGRERPRRLLVRVVEGLGGCVRLRVEFSPRLDYGEIKPWIQAAGPHAHVAVGSNTGLLLSGDLRMSPAGDHDLVAEFDLRAGERAHLAMKFIAPERLDARRAARPLSGAEIERRLDETLAWWRGWASKLACRGRPGVCAARSAIVLKALTYARSGAIVAAPTTSLPEDPGGERNWDYRYSWVRDSVFTVRALASVGCAGEADAFGRFIRRSAAGQADEMQVMYAVDGKRRLTEVVLPHLEGWRGSRPVRIGNAADKQFQSDMYGLLLELAWRSSRRGNRPDAGEWQFLTDIVEAAIESWRRPDHGIWEMRCAPRHFVHSKVMCWAAVQRGLELAQSHALPAPSDRWSAARDEIRAAVQTHGIDRRRGTFVASFDSTDLDAALLLLPDVGFVPYGDPCMRRTALAIARELDEGGLVLRYRSADGLRGGEGVFLPCSFWLAECFAKQGLIDEAQSLFERASGCANDLGLFAEEYAPAQRELLGNFPQGLSHLSHLSAEMALAGVTGRRAGAACDPVRGAIR